MRIYSTSNQDKSKQQEGEGWAALPNCAAATGALKTLHKAVYQRPSSRGKRWIKQKQRHNQKQSANTRCVLSCSHAVTGWKGKDIGSHPTILNPEGVQRLVSVHWATRRREGCMAGARVSPRSNQSTYSKTKWGKGPDPLYLLWQNSSLQAVGVLPE